MEGKTSDNNIIYLNTLSGSGTSNVIVDSVSGNVWNSPTKLGYLYGGPDQTYKRYMGNYYDDYTGSDADGDGIGDTSYTPSSGMVDEFPIFQSLGSYDLQTWWLSECIMYRGDMSQRGASVTLNSGSYQVWAADEPAIEDTEFGNGNQAQGTSWSGQVTFAVAPASGDAFVIEIGYADDQEGDGFVAGGPDATMLGDGSKAALTFITDADLLTVPSGKYLAMSITNGGSEHSIRVGGSWSYCSAPEIGGNEPPTVEAGGPYSVDEGGSVEVSASGSDPEGQPLGYAWDLDNNGTFETLEQTVTFSAAGLDGPGTRTIAVQVTDTGGLAATDEATVNVLNVAPTVGDITVPVEPVDITEGQPISVSATFTDPGVPDTHTATWDWGDGTDPTAGSVNQSEDSVSGDHTYNAPGVYTVTLTVTDDDGDSDTKEATEYIVIYDPDGGFVTGGGWIDSPEGAYTPDPLLTGKANFGFVSKYKKGADTPTGKTEFNFRVADLNFRSTVYEWLVVAGPHAKYKGTGTVNNEGEYGFMLTATDGDVSGGGGVDKFRIKIWDNATEDVVYDNKLGVDDDSYEAQEINDGSIVIHKDSAAPPLPLPEAKRLLAAYPNPGNPEIWLPYQLDSACQVAIRVYDMSGRLVRSLNLGEKQAGYYISREQAAYWDGRNEAGEQVTSGIYFYSIQAGEFTATKKMVITK